MMRNRPKTWTAFNTLLMSWSLSLLCTVFTRVLVVFGPSGVSESRTLLIRSDQGDVECLLGVDDDRGLDNMRSGLCLRAGRLGLLIRDWWCPGDESHVLETSLRRAPDSDQLFWRCCWWWWWWWCWVCSCLCSGVLSLVWLMVGVGEVCLSVDSLNGLLFLGVETLLLTMLGTRSGSCDLVLGLQSFTLLLQWTMSGRVKVEISETVFSGDETALQSVLSFGCFWSLSVSWLSWSVVVTVSSLFSGRDPWVCWLLEITDDVADDDDRGDCLLSNSLTISTLLFTLSSSPHSRWRSFRTSNASTRAPNNKRDALFNFCTWTWK